MIEYLITPVVRVIVIEKYATTIFATLHFKFTSHDIHYTPLTLLVKKNQNIKVSCWTIIIACWIINLSI